MSPREVTRREARLRELSMTAEPTQAERRELEDLHRWRDGVWRRLPSRIARLRHTLGQLERQANDLGLGPC